MSKWKIYDFHYNFIQKTFNAELLFTDTDSLTYEIKSENIYEDFFKWKDVFDFSNYSKDSKFFYETNKKVIGKMTDEFGGIIVSEFVGLKSKMYLIKNIDGKEHNTAKGVRIELNLTNLRMFYLIKKIRQKLKRIQSKKHKLGTYEIDKISLSCFDKKRIHTLSYFHKNSVTSCKNKKNIIIIIIIVTIFVRLLKNYDCYCDYCNYYCFCEIIKKIVAIEKNCDKINSVVI